MSAVRKLLERAQPGSRSAVDQHIKRGEKLAARIAEKNPEMRVPQQWRVAKLRRALESLHDKSAGTQYHYWRSARAIMDALGRYDDWSPHLRGPWTHPHGKPLIVPASGGRPRKTSGNR